MLFWTLQISIISIILIFLVHYLINFFKTTLTVPKIKDLVNTPTQKYENMYSIIANKHDDFNNNFNNNSKKDYTEIDLLPKPDESSMKNELKNFLKKQLNKTPDSTNIANLGSNSGNNNISYSSY